MEEGWDALKMDSSHPKMVKSKRRAGTAHMSNNGVNFNFLIQSLSLSCVGGDTF